MSGLLRALHFENIHPVLVHFPVALSTLYVVLELIPFKKIRDSLFTTKSILAILAFISIFAARQTGQVARQAYSDIATLRIIKVHQAFANLSFLIFGLIFILYVVQVAQKIKPKLFKSKTGKLFSLVSTNPFILITLAVLGLITVSLTGAIGGIIVWGSQNDPFTQLIYGLFFR